MLSYDNRRAHCERTFYTDALLSSNLSGVKKIRVTYLFLLDVCPANTEPASIYPSTVAINPVTTTTTPRPLPRDFINKCRHFLAHKAGPDLFSHGRRR